MFLIFLSLRAGHKTHTMNFDKLVKTYVNISGTVSFKNFAAILMLALAYLALSEVLLINENTVMAFNVYQENSFFRNFPDIRMENSYIDLFKIYMAVSFVIVYLLFVTTFKYCRKMNMPLAKCIVMGLLTTGGIWFLRSFVPTIVRMWDGQYTTSISFDVFSLMATVAGICVIIYLYKNGREDDFPYAVITRKVSFISLIFFFLSMVRLFYINYQIIFPLSNIVIIAFVLAYIHAVLPYAAKTWPGLPNVWVLTAIYLLLTLGGIYSGLTNYISSPYTLLILLMEIAGNIFYLFLLALSLPLLPVNEELQEVALPQEEIITEGDNN